MKQIYLSSIAELLAQPLWDTRNLVFRGVPDIGFDLRPSIGRITSETPDGLQRFEVAVLDDFSRKALPFLPKPPSSQLEWMCLAQHYGIPTRLLDWTTNPLVALYFAASGDGEADFAVYEDLQSTWLNSFAADSPFAIENVVGVRPPHVDVRYVNQEGVFTLHPRPTESYQPTNCKKYVFSTQYRDEARWKLRKLGFGAARAFYSLEGLAKDILFDSDLHLHRGTIRGSAAER